MNNRTTRRQWLTMAGAGAVGGLLCARGARAAGPDDRDGPLGFCLNTATIRGQRLGIVEEVKVAAAAGYGAIEPWIGSLRAYRSAGGSLAELGRRIADAGLKVPGAIGFARWIVDDPTERAAALERLEADMELVAGIGGTAVAAPPAGATRKPLADLRAAGERYAAVLELGEKMGVGAMLEIWGASRTCGRLSEAVAVAMESGHPAACILPDVYHLYRGGSDFDGLKLLGPGAMRVFHVNDYPAGKPREQLTDADRLMPGDGAAPLGGILRDLRAIGFRGWLSLELFHRDWWRRPAAETARVGLAKMKAALAGAGA